MKLVKLTVAAILATGALFAGTYNVDTTHSSVGFKVKHLMISNVRGTFDKFSGTISYDEKSKKVTSLNGSIEVSSVNTDNVKRDGHLKSADFFDAANFKNITFELSSIKGETAYGKLTMRGVTKDVSFELENNGTITDPWGNQRLGLTLNGKVNRIDYGLKYNSVLEAGGVAVGEIVKFEIELESILAKAKK